MQYSGKRGHEIGQVSERVVVMALQQLQSEGKIKGFVRRDEPGRDFFVTPLDDREVSFQVKSSYRRKKHHEKKYGRNSIPVIVVHHNMRKMPEQQMRQFAQKVKLDVLKMIGTLASKIP